MFDYFLDSDVLINLLQFWCLMQERNYKTRVEISAPIPRKDRVAIRWEINTNHVETCHKNDTLKALINNAKNLFNYFHFI